MYNTSLKSVILTTENSAEDSLLRDCLNGITDSSNVTVLNKTFYNYDGSNLVDTDLFILTANYNWNASGSSNDLSNSVQQNLIDFVSNGGGLLTSEWIMWHSAQRNKLNNLKTVFPINPTAPWVGRTILFFSKVTEDKVVSAGLPNTWSWSPANVDGVETYFTEIKPNAIIFYNISPGINLLPTATPTAT